MPISKSLLFAALLFASTGPVQASIDDDIVEAIDSFYNLEFEQALSAATRVEHAYPDHPAGAFYAGVAYFQRWLLEDPPQPDTLAAFEKAIDRSLRKARTLEHADPAISHYYRGACLGFQARALVAHRNYVAAIPKARQGLTQLEQALALDPSLEDANLGLGMYYYFCDRIPTALKPFSSLMVGMWGDRQKGLALLERTMTHGRVARREAQAVLAAIYTSSNEKNWQAAVPLLDDLMIRYPRNPRYRLALAYVYQRGGHWQQSSESLAMASGWVQGLAPLSQTMAVRVATMRQMENHLFQGELDQASASLARLTAEPLPAYLAEWATLRRANLLDAQKKFSESKPLYRSLKTKKAKLLGSQFIKTPFPAGPRDVMPNRWPLPVVPE